MRGDQCGFGFVKVMYVLYLNKPLVLSFKVYSIRRVKDRAQRHIGIYRDTYAYKHRFSTKKTCLNSRPTFKSLIFIADKSTQK